MTFGFAIELTLKFKNLFNTRLRIKSTYLFCLKQLLQAQIIIKRKNFPSEITLIKAFNTYFSYSVAHVEG